VLLPLCRRSLGNQFEPALRRFYSQFLKCRTPDRPWIGPPTAESSKFQRVLWTHSQLISRDVVIMARCRQAHQAFIAALERGRKLMAGRIIGAKAG
jgi:hypothetical protein